MAEATGTRDLPDVTLLWLEITQRCQLECMHCYASSGPTRTHGTMTNEMWIRVIDQAAAAGVRSLKFIGGEPTLHPWLPELVTHTVSRGLRVSIYSNLLRIPAGVWQVLTLPGVELETSYYSDGAEQHDAITGRPGSYRRTMSTIGEARDRGIPVRAGMVVINPDQQVERTRERLRLLGIHLTCIDRVRRIGRAAGTAIGERPGELCGRCARDRLAVCADGAVRPCVLARWISLGNVNERDLRSIIADTAARRHIHSRIVAASGDPGQRCPP